MKIGCFFEKKTRDDGSVFVTLAENRPEWLYDACYEAHQTDAPNDWIWAECRAAADAIDEGSLSDEDDLHEHAYSRVDIYTRDLYQWQADMCLTSTYSYAKERAMTKAVSVLQFCAIETIAGTILRAWQENTESEDK